MYITAYWKKIKCITLQYCYFCMCII